MLQKQMRPAPLATGTGLGDVLTYAGRISTTSNLVAERQAAFVSARFGLAADRARLVAGFAFSNGGADVR